MPAAVSHLNKVLSDKTRKPMQEKAVAARNMGLLNWIGMETNEEYGEIVAQGGDTIRIIKPFADHNKILDEIKFAEERGVKPEDVWMPGMDTEGYGKKAQTTDAVSGASEEAHPADASTGASEH